MTDWKLTNWRICQICRTQNNLTPSHQMLRTGLWVCAYCLQLLLLGQGSTESLPQAGLPQFGMYVFVVPILSKECKCWLFFQFVYIYYLWYIGIQIAPVITLALLGKNPHNEYVHSNCWPWLWIPDVYGVGPSELKGTCEGKENLII